ncbi:12984_t:CDS:2 [Ambispora gerdemannii]|uniref:12984_t:CDS:1 n=1 Tax=Ambispora gerdemannii TaxID=144530 RepID=A0A9N9BSB2_9GLOM|nr:12984_t:CDS:2 [Ambispora gerdemannii]
MNFENQDNNLLLHLNTEYSHINQNYDTYNRNILEKNTSNDIVMSDAKDNSSVSSSSISLSSSVQSFRTETPFSFVNMSQVASTQSLNLIFHEENSPIDQLLSIFNTGNDAYEDDEKIVEKVEHWLKQTQHDPEHLFNQVYEQRDKLKYSSLLAFLYYWGIGTRVNREETFYWYLKAAQSGKDFLAQNQPSFLAPISKNLLGNNNVHVGRIYVVFFSCINRYGGGRRLSLP